MEGIFASYEEPLGISQKVFHFYGQSAYSKLQDNAEHLTGSDNTKYFKLLKPPGKS